MSPSSMLRLTPLPLIHTFLLLSKFCSVPYVEKPPVRRNPPYEPISEPCIGNYFLLILPAFLATCPACIIPHTSACIHSCISYSYTPNTECPVLGVHINIFETTLSYQKFNEIFVRTCISFVKNYVSNQEATHAHT